MRTCQNALTWVECVYGKVCVPYALCAVWRTARSPILVEQPAPTGTNGGGEQVCAC